MQKTNWKKLENENLKGKIFVIPTDTIYGFSALSFDEIGIKKIYKIKNREKNKPLINLISSLNDLKKFKIKLNQRQKNFLEKIWPGKISVILKDKDGNKISFRIPKKRSLRNFIKKVGPIVSTSFNISGEKFKKDLSEIDKFPEIDFYIDEGNLNSSESTIIEIIR